MELDGMKALVTGGKRRIGRGIAQALAAAGCDVGINDLVRDDDADETVGRVLGLGRDALFVAGDVSNADHVQRMVAGCVQRFGGLDILVNNAYWAEAHPFTDIEESVWERTLAVSLKGYFLCSQHAARAMIAQGGGGSIVSISSVHAHRVWPGDTCYGVAKAGILRMTQTMAVDLGPHGIRCNAIQPGYVDTDHEYGDLPPAVGSAPEHLHRFIPLRRHTTPEDIGRAAVFLSSRAASAISGVSLPIDGALLATGVP
jgi:NAD(P)-dependent dehydrogenase (short-subunit alcohol dehydrogenase family)